MTRNPKWEYNELVLALEVYMLHRPNPPGKNSRDVKILSTLLRLNKLSENININKTFRNKNGVSMKLQNFRRFDPMFKGKGLRQGGGLERDIWDRFQNLRKLQKTCDTIRSNIENKINNLK
jgi:5-methylcytosine-specific restriction protein A